MWYIWTLLFGSIGESIEKNNKRILRQELNKARPVVYKWIKNKILPQFEQLNYPKTIKIKCPSIMEDVCHIDEYMLNKLLIEQNMSIYFEYPIEYNSVVLKPENIATISVVSWGY
jgi:hypothetical protein